MSASPESVSITVDGADGTGGGGDEGSALLARFGGGSGGKGTKSGGVSATGTKAARGVSFAPDVTGGDGDGDDGGNIGIHGLSSSHSMDFQLTLGAGSINALTYRSFVDPKEARPDMGNYDPEAPLRQRTRIADMHTPGFKVKSQRKVAQERADMPEDTSHTGSKFGTWDGVFTSSLLNIFGVIMFLRLGWVVGQAGVPLALLIIAIACVVTTLTSLSMSAIVTNGTIRAGGAYYIISRSMGPRIGGSIGFLFSLGMSVAIALYVIGFCETFVDQMFDTFSLTGDVLNDTRLWGLILLGIIFIMTLIGVDWVIKLQLGLLALLILSIVSFFIGGFIVDDENAPDGIVGIHNGNVLGDNIAPDFTEYKGKDYNFMSVFAVFFPAVTGIMAGANISGDLANPSQAIPRGTLWSIAVSTAVYMGMAVMAGAAVRRSVEPTLTDKNGNLVSNTEDGLLYDVLIMVKVSVWGPLVLAGIYAATFSSALASLVGAPRVLQMLAADGIVPFVKFFAKVRESDGAPIRGYCFAVVIGAGCVLIGELNVIAPLVTMFFMMTYALINFACFFLSISKSPGWRPSFTMYTWYLSLAGGIICLVIMFIIDLLYAVVALAISLAIYGYIAYMAVPVQWGSAFQASQDLMGVKVLMGLQSNDTHVKTFRPNYLVLCGEPSKRPELVRFMGTLFHGRGAIIYGRVIIGDYEKLSMDADFVESIRSGYYVHTDAEESVVPGADDEHAEAQTVVQAVNLEKVTEEVERGSGADDGKEKGKNGAGDEEGKDAKEEQQGDGVTPAAAAGDRPGFFRTRTARMAKASTDRSCNGFLDTVVAKSVYQGSRFMMQCSGLGRIRPNTLVIGFKEDWFNQGGGVGALMKRKTRRDSEPSSPASGTSPMHGEGDHVDASSAANRPDTQTAQYVRIIQNALRLRMGVMVTRGLDKIKWNAGAFEDDGVGPVLAGEEGVSAKPAVRMSLSQDPEMFRGRIDVWWMCDDGGLIVLISYILSLDKFWKAQTAAGTDKCLLRIIMVVESSKNVAELYKMVTKMLSNFRIKCEMKVLNAGRAPPSGATLEKYQSRSGTLLADQSRQAIVTRRWLRVSELMHETSNLASLVLCTMPFPHDDVHSMDFMCLMDVISENLPATVFVRGNDQDVLTFRSE